MAEGYAAPGYSCRDMRLVYFGSGAFGLPTLKHLAARHEIAMVVTQPDRPSGRGGAVNPTPVGEWCVQELAGVPVQKPEKVNEASVREAIRACGADAWVVIAFGQKLGPKLLEGVMAVNLHASLLPRWRGAAPINAAILAGDSVTGNSVITLADRMDAGFLLGKTEREIDPTETAGELHDELAEDGPELVESVLEQHRAGALKQVKQDEGAVTVASKLSKADSWVDFSQGAEACRRRVLGLTPWPGVTVQFRDLPLKLTRVGVEEGPGEEAPGTLLNAESGVVSCTGGRLAVLEVHPAGRKNMTWAEFARGHRVQAGERFIGRAHGGAV